MSGSRERFLRLYHIRDACLRAADFIRGYDFDMFCRDEKTQNAVIHQIQIIGEAAAALDLSLREEIPDVPWQDVIGMRSKIVHDYFEIELKLVCDTATIDIPHLLIKVNERLSP